MLYNIYINQTISEMSSNLYVLYNVKQIGVNFGMNFRDETLAWQHKLESLDSQDSQELQNLELLRAYFSLIHMLIQVRISTGR